MIISHKYKFIFLKTRKTAGTSIEISLSRYCGKDDIITPISPRDEEIRKRLGKYPQNYVKGKYKFYNHITAYEVKKLIGDHVWNSYYKFCFDRNPWDKVISLFYYLHPTNSNFNKFIEEGHYKTAYNFPIYTIYDIPVMDYVGKYENLNSDLINISNKIDLPFDGWLPKAKGNFRKGDQNYQKHYTKYQKEIIKSFYKNEIYLLDYKY